MIIIITIIITSRDSLLMTAMMTETETEKVGNTIYFFFFESLTWLEYMGQKREKKNRSRCRRCPRRDQPVSH